MKNTLKKKIKSLLTNIARILIIVVAIIKVIQFFRKDEKADIKTETVITQQPIINEDITKANPLPSKISEPEILITNSSSVKISEILKYKGKVISDAYFTVINCSSCKSSISNKSGIAIAYIPHELYYSDREYDFYVYSKDTLTYHKSMRFSDLQFNKY